MAGTFLALVIEQDADVLARLLEWLAEEGFVAIGCAGPHSDEIFCPAESDAECLLASSADLIVIDLRLASDEMFEGIPGWQLLAYYRDLGVPVVAIADPDELVSSEPDPRLRVIRRSAGRSELIDAARALLGTVALETDQGTHLRAPRWSRHPVRGMP